jgi:hypothetical protein
MALVGCSRGVGIIFKFFSFKFLPDPRLEMAKAQKMATWGGKEEGGGGEYCMIEKRNGGSVGLLSFTSET